MNEREKMMLGEWYDANNDELLIKERLIAQDLCFQYNQLSPLEEEKRLSILKELLPYVPKGLTILTKVSENSPTSI